MAAVLSTSVWKVESVFDVLTKVSASESHATMREATGASIERAVGLTGVSGWRSARSTRSESCWTSSVSLSTMFFCVAAGVGPSRGMVAVCVMGKALPMMTEKPPVTGATLQVTVPVDAAMSKETV